MRTQWLAGILALVTLSSCTFIVDRQRLVKHYLSATVTTPDGPYIFRCTRTWHFPVAYLGLKNTERFTCSTIDKQAKLELGFQDKSTDPFLLYSTGLLNATFTSLKPKVRTYQLSIPASYALESNQSEYIYFDRISRQGIQLSGHWHKQSKLALK